MPTEFDKAEMKAMMERKRRNDYVRKRELDTLRRIRRQGLWGDQAQALTMQSSRMDESVEARSTRSSVQSVGIKAKIDAIERQMVGASSSVSAGGPPPRAPRTAPTLPPGPPPPILTTHALRPRRKKPRRCACRWNVATKRDRGAPGRRAAGFDPARQSPTASTPRRPRKICANALPYDGAPDQDPFAPPRPVHGARRYAPLEFTATRSRRPPRPLVRCR